MAGGVATSFVIDEKGLYINDGVQGGAPSYRNTLLIHKVYIKITKLVLFWYIFANFNLLLSKCTK